MMMAKLACRMSLVLMFLMRTVKLHIHPYSVCLNRIGALYILNLESYSEHIARQVKKSLYHAFELGMLEVGATL